MMEEDPTWRAKEALVASKREAEEEVTAGLTSLRLESARQVEDARTLIKDLSRSLSEADRGGDDDEVATRYERARRRLALVEAERLKLANQKEELLENSDDDGDSRARAEAAEAQRLEHAASLYQNITGIKWNASSPEDTLSGVIAYEHLQTARRFSIPTGKLDRVDLADALWQLIDHRSPA